MMPLPAAAGMLAHSVHHQHACSACGAERLAVHGPVARAADLSRRYSGQQPVLPPGGTIV